MLFGLLIGFVIGMGVGAFAGSNSRSAQLTDFPDKDGASGPHCVFGKFFYSVPEARWNEAVANEAMAAAYEKIAKNPPNFRSCRPPKHDFPQNLEELP